MNNSYAQEMTKLIFVRESCLKQLINVRSYGISICA
jgi:hypothetical protein